MRRLLLSLLVAAALVPGAAVADPVKGGKIDVATIGEPPTLDPMANTGDLLGMITQHVYETLFTFDGEWRLQPLLAEAMPAISDDGRTYDIKIRPGVTFHDGEPLTAADVVASLERWMRVASRGKQAAPMIESVAATGDLSVRMKLKQAYAPLLSLLAFNNSAAVIMPKAHMDEPLTEVVGTGPYKLAERKPDQYILLTRFDGYAARGEKPSRYAGRRTAYLDEIRFIPVPNANTRIEGAISGQYDLSDLLPVESYDRLTGLSTTEPVILKSFGYPIMMLNTKQGPLAKLELRQAVQAALSESDMMLAAFGKPEFFTVDGAMYPEGFPWRNDAGVDTYDQGNPEKAQELMEKAGYAGEPIRILTSQQYEFHYKMALVAAEYLKAAGFKVDLQVSDWATLTQRRNDPALWEIFFTHSPFLPEPALNLGMSESGPGWWSTERRRAAFDAFNAASDPEQRAKLYADVQAAIMEEVPFIKVGDFNALSAKSPKLKGYEPSPWPSFWNTWVEK
ncbi:ABC transporter substrate-binding protein [Inquilinus limosus]|uniref:ABC transporter substrate-binding protein n=1 Tax=Inquilinus limosus TaxID=171674 RepID=UPI00047DEF7E|nr:ABC transporter substrate-binding protein [Inquilinus limosus]